MNEQPEWSAKLKRDFDDSVGSLDAGTLVRIAHCRQLALARANRVLPAVPWLPAGAVAAVCLALLIHALLPEHTVAPPQPAAATPAVLEQMDMISDLELYEDLEFYQWLEQYELPS